MPWLESNCCLQSGSRLASWWLWFLIFVRSWPRVRRGSDPYLLVWYGGIRYSTSKPWDWYGSGITNDLQYGQFLALSRALLKGYWLGVMLTSKCPLLQRRRRKFGYQRHQKWGCITRTERWGDRWSTHFYMLIIKITQIMIWQPLESSFNADSIATINICIKQPQLG